MRLKIAFATIFLSLFCGPAFAEVFEVAVDHAKILHLPRPASAVIVGNPAIADATVFKGNMLFITGKTFGATNFIALDAEGKTILSRNLQVSPSKRRMTLYRGSYQSSYLCADGCEPAPGVGDDADTFQRLFEQQVAKADQGVNAANGN